MNTANYSLFEVTEHYYLEERGGFVIGQIFSGQFKVGMIVTVEEDGKELTISGIEFLDNLAEKIYKQALIFTERPDLEYLKIKFPVGSMLKAYERTT